LSINWQGFEAITKPELTKLWQYGRIMTTDWKVGGNIKFRSEEGRAEALEQWGTILDIWPNGIHKISFVYTGI
jgi:hypothetical protein